MAISFSCKPNEMYKTESGRGKRIAHKTPEHQMKWLIEQAEKHGFEISMITYRLWNPLGYHSANETNE